MITDVFSDENMTSFNHETVLLGPTVSENALNENLDRTTNTMLSSDRTHNQRNALFTTYELSSRLAPSSSAKAPIGAMDNSPSNSERSTLPGDDEIDYSVYLQMSSEDPEIRDISQTSDAEVSTIEGNFSNKQPCNSHHATTVLDEVANESFDSQSSKPDAKPFKKITDFFNRADVTKSFDNAAGSDDSNSEQEKKQPNFNCRFFDSPTKEVFIEQVDEFQVSRKRVEADVHEPPPSPRTTRRMNKLRQNAKTMLSHSPIGSTSNLQMGNGTADTIEILPYKSPDKKTRAVLNAADTELAPISLARCKSNSLGNATASQAAMRDVPDLTKWTLFSKNRGSGCSSISFCNSSEETMEGTAALQSHNAVGDDVVTMDVAQGLEFASAPNSDIDEQSPVLLASTSDGSIASVDEDQMRTLSSLNSTRSKLASGRNRRAGNRVAACRQQSKAARPSIQIKTPSPVQLSASRVLELAKRRRSAVVRTNEASELDGRRVLPSRAAKRPRLGGMDKAQISTSSDSDVCESPKINAQTAIDHIDVALAVDISQQRTGEPKLYPLFKKPNIASALQPVIDAEFIVDQTANATDASATTDDETGIPASKCLRRGQRQRKVLTSPPLPRTKRKGLNSINHEPSFEVVFDEPPPTGLKPCLKAALMLNSNNGANCSGADACTSADISSETTPALAESFNASGDSARTVKKAIQFRKKNKYYYITPRPDKVPGVIAMPEDSPPRSGRPTIPVHFEYESEESGATTEAVQNDLFEFEDLPFCSHQDAQDVITSSRRRSSITDGRLPSTGSSSCEEEVVVIAKRRRKSSTMFLTHPLSSAENDVNVTLICQQANSVDVPQPVAEDAVSVDLESFSARRPRRQSAIVAASAIKLQSEVDELRRQPPRRAKVIGDNECKAFPIFSRNKADEGLEDHTKLVSSGRKRRRAAVEVILSEDEVVAVPELTWNDVPMKPVCVDRASFASVTHTTSDDPLCLPPSTAYNAAHSIRITDPNVSDNLEIPAWTSEVFESLRVDERASNAYIPPSISRCNPEQVQALLDWLAKRHPRCAVHKLYAVYKRNEIDKSKMDNEREDERCLKVGDVEDGFNSKRDATSGLWTEDFRPTTGAYVLGHRNVKNTLKCWLKEWRNCLTSTDRADAGHRRHGKKNKKQRKSTDGSDDDDFIATDNSGVERRSGNGNMVMLTGPQGCGKTCLLYALAGQIGFQVIELNASSKRSGRQVLCAVEGATHSHRVVVNNLPPDDIVTVGEKPSSPSLVVESNRKPSQKGGLFAFWSSATSPKVAQSPSLAGKVASAVASGKITKSSPAESATSRTVNVAERAKHTVIFLKDVHLLFEEDESFWVAIKMLCERSLTPVVMTAADTNCPGLDTVVDFVKVLSLEAPPEDLVCCAAQVMCLAHSSVLVSEASIRALVQACRCDIRRIMLGLQFWLESSIIRCPLPSSTPLPDVDSEALAVHVPLEVCGERSINLHAAVFCDDIHDAAAQADNSSLADTMDTTRIKCKTPRMHWTARFVESLSEVFAQHQPADCDSSDLGFERDELMDDRPVLNKELYTGVLRSNLDVDLALDIASLTLDIVPNLRAICSAEEVKKMSGNCRRFLHYLDKISLDNSDTLKTWLKSSRFEL